jgi:hypothetical protein
VPPSAPGSVTATGVCKVVVLTPEITLSWAASTTGPVTSYRILRGPTATSMTTVATVGAATTTYTDTGVSGLGATYWYAVQAVNSAGTTTSAAVSGTTPTLCV